MIESDWLGCFAAFSEFAVKRLSDVDDGIIVIASGRGRAVASLVVSFTGHLGLIPLSGLEPFTEYCPSGATPVVVAPRHIWTVEPTMVTSSPEQYDERGDLTGRLWLRTDDRGLVYRDANDKIQFASFEGNRSVRTLNVPTYFFDSWRLTTCGEIHSSALLAEFGYIT